jgi:hypothetical protein
MSRDIALDHTAFGSSEIMKRTHKGHRLVFLFLGASLGGGLISSSEGQKRGPLQKFVRQKLEHAKNVLEGLTVEVFTLIANSARMLVYRFVTLDL